MDTKVEYCKYIGLALIMIVMVNYYGYEDYGSAIFLREKPVHVTFSDVTIEFSQLSKPRRQTSDRIRGEFYVMDQKKYVSCLGFDGLCGKMDKIKAVTLNYIQLNSTNGLMDSLTYVPYDDPTAAPITRQNAWNHTSRPNQNVLTAYERSVSLYRQLFMGSLIFLPWALYHAFRKRKKAQEQKLYHYE